MSLMETLASALTPEVVSGIAGMLGTDKNDTQSAIFKMAVPMIVGGLAKNSQKPEGAQALQNALNKDHSGGLLGDLGGFLQSEGAATAGASILKHVLGGKQAAAQTQIEKTPSFGGAQAGQLLAMLAPVVMSALAKKKSDDGLDAQGLTASLGEARQSAESESDGPSFLEGLLDADGDGDIVDDVVSTAGPLLASLLK